MPRPDADRNLLFGILALQLDFIARDALIAGMNAWLLEEDRPEQADFLASRLLGPETTPDEVLVIRDALTANHLTDKAVTPARAAMSGKVADLTDAQLRAAAAMAGMVPGDPALASAAGPIARKLARENPLQVDAWREAFQPIAPALVGPLRLIYARRDEPEPRALAFTILSEFATQPDNPREPEDLAALVGDADPDQFRRILARLGSAANRDRAVAVLAGRVKEPAHLDGELSRGQGRMALALLRLGRPDPVWPLLRHRDDPSVRTELIHNMARFGLDPGPVAGRLRGGAEADVSAHRALVLCLGQFPPDSVPDRPALASELLARYRSDPDPGLHGAIDWLLRVRWGLGAAVGAIDRDLAGVEPPPGRDWFVNGQGQAYTIIRGPVEFRMGSTGPSDPERSAAEVPHLRRIGRSFAIASREVTVVEYIRFLEEQPAGVFDWRNNPELMSDFPGMDGTMGFLTFYDAARYCNWLSARERIPEGQWCYPKEIGPGMKLPPDHLERAGYRLPTEAEWEYACRAGSSSSRPYGGQEAWLAEYAWYLENSGRKMHPAGRKAPNDLGLFDILGNAFEWCVDPYKAYPPPGDGRAIVDLFMDADFSDDVGRVLRGGSFHSTAIFLRAALRDRYLATTRYANIGVRPARTYP